MPDVKRILHAVETPRHAIVISHGEPFPQVHEVDEEGRTLRVIADPELCRAIVADCMSMDAQGRVFLAERNAGRILLLNLRLELDRVLLSTSSGQSARSRKDWENMDRTGSVA